MIIYITTSAIFGTDNICEQSSVARERKKTSLTRN